VCVSLRAAPLVAKRVPFSERGAREPSRRRVVVLAARGLSPESVRRGARARAGRGDGRPVADLQIGSPPPRRHRRDASK